MKYILTIIIGVGIGYLIFGNSDYKDNSKLSYGSTGFPKNCRAIIKANYEGYISKEFTSEGALDSINRNCGEFGYSWKK